jgi:hypothetical protein
VPPGCGAHALRHNNLAGSMNPSYNLITLKCLHMFLPRHNSPLQHDAGGNHDPFPSTVYTLLRYVADRGRDDWVVPGRHRREAQSWDTSDQHRNNPLPCVCGTCDCCIIIEDFYDVY